MNIWNRFFTRRKKLFLTSLTFSALMALILSVVLVEVSIASQTNVSINPPSVVDPTLVPTTQFTVHLWVDYVEPNLLWTYQLTLSFNPDVLHGVSVANGPFMGSQGQKVIVVPGTGFDNNVGKLGLFAAYLAQFSKFPRGGSDEYGPLCSITFEVVGYGSSPITLGIETGLGNKTGGWIIHKARDPEFFFDSYFNNKPVYVDPPQVRGVTVGESFTVNITASNIEDLYSWELYMNWSAPLLNATNVAEGDFLKSQPDGTQFYQEIHNDEGYIYANCTRSGATGVTGSGTLANVTFLVEDNGNSTLNLYDTLFLNSSRMPIPLRVIVRNATKSIPYPDWNTSWENNAYSSDDTYANATKDGADIIFRDYGFTEIMRTRALGFNRIAKITRIEIGIEGYCPDGDDYIQIQVSWNAGTNWTDPIDYTLPIVDSDLITYINLTNLRIWSPHDLWDANFRVNITKRTVGQENTTNLDWVPMKVTIALEPFGGWFTNEKHNLTIDSSPISGIEFTLDGTPHTTPFSDDLEDNYYTVVMTETQRISGKTYGFANWTDGSTNRTKVIDLTADMTLTANYDILPLPVHNIDIDYDFETIQEAIDAVETLDGHTILVDAGTYYENVLLHKSLKLTGENSSNTIIDGTLSGDVIEVAAHNVTITGFTIVNGDFEGIYVDGYGGTLISDNIIANCTWDAIALIFSNDNTISDNVLIQSGYSGVFMDSCNNNTIYENTIYLNGYGFEWYSSDNNTVVANFFVNGTDGGILLDDCESNLFYHNNFVNNTQHVSLSFSLNNVWNSSYPTGGNYWDDYVGNDLYSGPDQDEPGSDGIGDTLYSIDVDNNDTYPLMNLWKGHVIINKAVVSDNRCDIGSQQNVSFHAKWSLTGSDVMKGLVYVNGTEYSLNGTGWISFNTLAYDTVGKRLWNVTGVLVEAFPSLNITTYVKTVDDPFIIWDRVSLTLGIIDDRIDVGADANVTWTGYYEYDSAAFAGTPSFNDTLSQDVVGGYWYTVASISDPTYGLSVFEADSVYCIFDRVQLVISIVDDRIDVGDLVTISRTGTYEYDDSTFDDIVTYNDTLSQDVVGGYWYTVASITDSTYDLTEFQSNSAYCIFDNVTITLTVNDDRIDVDSNASITASGVYQYDNEIYDGTITLNDTTIKSSVGEYIYTTQSISGDSHGITVFESNTVSVVFDKAHINLNIDDSRIDVGTDANVTWTGYYEYDLAAFAGTVTLNDTLTKDLIGRYWYTVTSISDATYGISVFEANSVHCIFDRVQIVISVEDNRINIGNTADLSWTGTYEYDSSTFEGLITYNDTLSKTIVGKYGFEAESISDTIYELTAFTTNEVEVIFDKVTITLSVEDDTIGVDSNASITWTATYQYDGTNFDGTITLNDTSTKSTAGTYHYTTESISGDTYGITTFESNTITITFESPTVISPWIIIGVIVIIGAAIAAIVFFMRKRS